MDRDNSSLVGPLKEVICFDDLLQLAGVVRVLCHDKNKRLDVPLASLRGVLLKLRLRLFMQTDAVFQLQLLKRRLVVVVLVEVLARGDRRALDVPVLKGLGQRVGVDDVLEGDVSLSLLYLRRRRQFEPEDRVKLVDGVQPRRCSVAMALVHQHDEVGQLG